MSVLVTGGAGFIGSHLIHLLTDRGERVVVVDDLSSGSADRIPGVPIVEMDLAANSSIPRLEATLKEFSVDSVVHFAARKRVDESVGRPAFYFQQNVGGLANLLVAAESQGVSRLLFSSSAAVYAASDFPVAEDGTVNPQNPYGETKLIGEWLARDLASVGKLKAISLRYFNVAGAGKPELSDNGILNLIPMVIEKIMSGRSPEIFGDDYDTPDGTCVRDFVHVQDVAEAHLIALDGLDSLPDPHSVFNIGTGRGESVRGIIDRLLEITGSNLRSVVRDRRPGDQAIVVAAVERIRQALGWRARFGLDDILKSSWEGYQVLHGPFRG